MKSHFLIPLVLMVSIGACAPHGPLGTPATPPATASKEWSPGDVRLSCPSGDCPAGVGLFAWLGRNERGEQTLSRCTATLIGPGRILTNAHCADPSSNEGYFFVRDARGETVYRRVDRQAFAVQSESFALDERDLAAWTLTEPLAGIAPLNVARAVPSDLTRLVAYVVNLGTGPGEDWETRFRVDRVECQTRPHVALLDAGAEDRSTRLALFGCEIRGGNSGSPLFAPGDRGRIQAVVNSIANFDPAAKRYGALFDSLFPAAPPAYLDSFFALAERVHCVEIPGIASADTGCAKPKSFKDDIGPAIEGLLAEHYRTSSWSEGVRWGERALSTTVSGHAVQAVTFVPVPICFDARADGPLAAETGAIAFHAMPTYRVGIDSDNVAQVTESAPREFLYRARRVLAGLEITPETQLNRYGFVDLAGARRLGESVVIPPCAEESVAEDLTKARLAFAGATFPPLPSDESEAEF